MLSDLAAIAAPAIVCVAFVAGAWALVRRELAPKHRVARAEAEASEDQSGPDRDQGTG